MVLAAALVAVYEMEGSQITNKGNNLFPHVFFLLCTRKILVWREASRSKSQNHVYKKINKHQVTVSGWFLPCIQMRTSMISAKPISIKRCSKMAPQPF